MAFDALLASTSLNSVAPPNPDRCVVAVVGNRQDSERYALRGHVAKAVPEAPFFLC